MKNLCKTCYPWVLLMVLALASCSEKENSPIEYVPFQETKDGQWGMISMEGEVLFKDEFKNMPTVTRDGRFFVKNKSGNWEMYEATEKPKKIGTEYVHASGFTHGVALVAEKNKPVSIIDTDGKEIKLLDKIEKKEVTGVRSFEGRHACFVTADTLWGAIDEKGNCVVKPEYVFMTNCSDGKFIAVHSKYKKEYKNGNKEKYKVSVINTNGEILFEVNASKYEYLAWAFTDNRLIVSVKKDGKECYGIIDEKGEEVVKPSNNLKDIGEVRGDVFTYNNGDGWGLMNLKGETLIRAKYESLHFATDGILMATIKKGDENERKSIDYEDNQIGEDVYTQFVAFDFFDGEHTWVKLSDKIYSLIDKKCQQVMGLPDIVSISLMSGESFIESDYVNISQLIEAFDIKQEGALGITFSSKPEAVVKKAVELGNRTGTKEHPAASPYWYDYSDDIMLSKSVNGVNVSLNVGFDSKLSRQTYRTERVIDYTWGNYYWYHDNKVPTGYVWNDVTPKRFGWTVDNSGRMKGKMRMLYDALSAKFKKMGTEAKKNNSAVVLNLKNGKRALVAMQKDRVFAVWGDMAKVEDIDIDQYKDANEDDDSEDTDTSDGNALDEATCDSVAADSACVADWE